MVNNLNLAFYKHHLVEGGVKEKIFFELLLYSRNLNFDIQKAYISGIEKMHFSIIASTIPVFLLIDIRI